MGSVLRFAREKFVCVAMATTLLLAGCATPPPPVVRLPELPDERPEPPMGAAEELRLPPMDELGRYITPNRGMTGQQALWHVRMALNVAALGCRGEGDVMGVEYNKMLRIHATSLTQANAAADAIYRTKFGTEALAMRDKIYTVVYNYFALPPAQRAFCPTARAVVVTINGLTPDALVAYAPQALEMLEKPFQDFWAAYAEYLRQLEAWRKRHVMVQVLPCPPNDPTCSGPAPASPPPPVPPAGSPVVLPKLVPEGAPRLPTLQVDEAAIR